MLASPESNNPLLISQLSPSFSFKLLTNSLSDCIFSPFSLSPDNEGVLDDIVFADTVVLAVVLADAPVLLVDVASTVATVVLLTFAVDDEPLYVTVVLHVVLAVADA